MGIDIKKLLAFDGNKYEACVAMMKYAKYLAQKNENSLEIPVSKHRKEKVTVVAINDFLNGVFTYEFDPNASKDEK